MFRDPIHTYMYITVLGLTHLNKTINADNDYAYKIAEKISCCEQIKEYPDSLTSFSI